MMSSRPCFAILFAQTSTCLAWGKRIHRSMNKYNITAMYVDAYEVLCITWHKMSWKPSVADQYTAFLTLPDCNMLPIWRQTPLIKMSSHCQAGTSNRQSSTFVDCTCKLRHLDTAHITQFLNWLCNLNVRILRMRNAISRLCKFSDCAEHIYGT